MFVIISTLFNFIFTPINSCVLHVWHTKSNTCLVQYFNLYFHILKNSLSLLFAKNYIVISITLINFIFKPNFFESIPIFRIKCTRSILSKKLRILNLFFKFNFEETKILIPVCNAVYIH